MNHPRPKLLIATYNEGKFKELCAMLSHIDIDLMSLKDIGEISDVEESGATFAENAAIKAAAYSKASRMWTLSDDSGLEVEALGGAPGVMSARYAGEGASDAQRIQKLLSEIKNSDAENRSARFICAVAVADETGAIRFTSEGECRGIIAETPIGKGGFGYDPIFLPDGFEQTFGELPSEVKDRISHRHRAVVKIIPFLLDFFGIAA